MGASSFILVSEVAAGVEATPGNKDKEPPPGLLQLERGSPPYSGTVAFDCLISRLPVHLEGE